MTLSVHGVHCELGEALKAHAAEKLAHLDEKYFGRGLQARVTVSKTERKQFRANIVYHAGHHDYQADGVAKDAHKALDIAASKLAKQLGRMKARIRDDHHNREKNAVDLALNESLHAV